MKASSLAVVSGVLLLLVVSHAWGECAWVLWAEMQTPTGDATSVVSASDTKQGCQRSLSEILDRMRTVKNAVVRQQTSQVLGPGMITRYICLPDTVDPRGPKPGR